MESQLQQSHETHGHDTLTADEHHGEKKSMMTKVKDKARKLKNSIMKNKQGEEQLLHEEDDDEDDDSNYQETIEDLDQVDGAPDANSGKPSGNSERTSVMAEDAKPPMMTSSHDKPLPVPTGVHGFALSQPSGPGHNQGYGKELNSENLDRPSVMVEDRDSKPVNSQGSGHLQDPVVNHGEGNDDLNQGEMRGVIGMSTGVVSGPHSPKDQSNYVSKDANSTNTDGKQELSELQHSFDKMGIDSEPKTLDHNHPENLPRENLTENPSSQSSTYVSKISSSAFAAKDAIASKLGYSGQTDSEPKASDHNPHEQLPRETLTETPSTESGTYASKISSSAFAAKDTVSSWFGGKGDAPQGTLGTSHVTDKGLSSNPTDNQNKDKE